jgi:uncharacterized OB-fold protein
MSGVGATITTSIPRLCPVITEENAFFWTSGATGVLRFLRCTECRAYVHPPAPVCRKCRAWSPQPEAVSGHASVLTFAISRQRWTDQYRDPFVVAIVVIDEAPDVRLTTNIVGCSVDEVEMDMRVSVAFEKCGDAFIPIFVPRLDERNPSD